MPTSSKLSAATLSAPVSRRGLIAMAAAAMATATLAAAVPSPAQADTVIIAPMAPPPLRYERRPPPPRHPERFIWRPGYWSWEHGRYVWVAGVWAPRPHGRRGWVPEHWVRRGNGWVLVPGHWR